MASGDHSRWISQLTKFQGANPHGDEFWSRISNTINTTVFAKESDIERNLSDTGKYSGSLAGYRECPIFPQARSPQCADYLGIRTRADGWNRGIKGINGNGGNGAWLRADSLGVLLMHLRAHLL